MYVRVCDDLHTRDSPSLTRVDKEFYGAHPIAHHLSSDHAQLMREDFVTQVRLFSSEVKAFSAEITTSDDKHF